MSDATDEEVAAAIESAEQEEESILEQIGKVVGSN